MTQRIEPELRPTWRVRKGRKYKRIRADYFKINEGILYFRNMEVNAYPYMVICFAPGTWETIERLS